MPAKILIVRLSHLGDVVHALGVFHALHEAYPAAEIGWVTQPEFAGLLVGLPGLSRVFRFDRRSGWRAWPRIRAELASFGADLAVDAQGNLKSAAVTWCSGAARRLGLAPADWRERLGAVVVNDPAPPLPPGAVHAMDKMLALARHAAPAASSPLRLDPGLATSERIRGEKELRRLLPAAGPGAVIAHLSSPGDIRAWPGERWAELAHLLAARGRPLLLVSGPAEAAVGERLAAELGNGPRLGHWVGQRGLRELAAVFAAAGRQGMRLVAGDSGPAHLAAAGGLPVLALAGPQDASRTGPWPRAGRGGHLVLRAESGPSCAPCRARRCDHAEGPVCMAGIPAAAVLAVLEA
ncbi:MAG: glycosyltransferase family 9 protein [Planctomycetota bacterium]